jgi:hypothetical protein
VENVDAIPIKILDRRLVKKGSAAVAQVQIQWSSLPEAMATWEYYNVLRARFPNAPVWGQPGSSGGGSVAPGSVPGDE